MENFLIMDVFMELGGKNGSVSPTFVISRKDFKACSPSQYVYIHVDFSFFLAFICERDLASMLLENSAMWILNSICD